MHNSAWDTDILIVGAGPVGLFLANECARRGLRFRLIETNSSQSRYSKALAIFPRTLEIFDMAGVVDPFLKAANRATAVAVITHGHTLARLQFQPDETPYQFIAMVPQDVTEKILLDELRRQGGAVEYGTSFVAAVEHENHVTATLESNGQRREITAAFVVGCDGAHSAVRHWLKLPFEGAQYDDLFLLADIESNEALPADEMQLCPSENGPLAIFPMSSTRRRIVATIHKQEGEVPSLELVRRLLAERAPAGIQARALRWTSYFRIHHRQVAQMSVGRMFVAGDAAHIHSPFGGQGMNTGLQDAWNLAWKLDLAVRGHGSERLLESYSAERRPVIKQVVTLTDRMTKAMGTPNKLAQMLRNAIIPMVSRLAPFQHAFVQRMAELDVAYEGSPIVEGHGERFFDDSIRGGQNIRSRFLILINDKAEASLLESAKRLSETAREVVELRPTQRPGITLVRPDGYIAYSGHDQDSIEAVRTLLAKQTVRGDDSAENGAA